MKEPSRREFTPRKFTLILLISVLRFPCLTVCGRPELKASGPNGCMNLGTVHPLYFFFFRSVGIVEVKQKKKLQRLRLARAMWQVLGNTNEIFGHSRFVEVVLKTCGTGATFVPCIQFTLYVVNASAVLHTHRKLVPAVVRVRVRVRFEFGVNVALESTAMVAGLGGCT